MGLFQRAHDIIEAKTNRALDNAESADEVLELSYEKMLEQLTHLRRALADVAASRKRIELQQIQLQHSMDHLEDEARSAVSQGQDDRAREALSRRSFAQTQVQAIASQHEQLREQEEKLTQTLDTLQQRVNAFRAQKDLLKARYSEARAVSTVDEEISGISKSIGDSGVALQHARDDIDTMSARASALDELLESGVIDDMGEHAGDIRQELDQIGASDDVDRQLRTLKNGSGPATTSSGSPNGERAGGRAADQ